MYIWNLHIYIYIHIDADSTVSCRVFSETNSEVNDKEVLRHAASVRVFVGGLNPHFDVSVGKSGCKCLIFHHTSSNIIV